MSSIKLNGLFLDDLRKKPLGYKPTSVYSLCIYFYQIKIHKDSSSKRGSHSMNNIIKVLSSISNKKSSKPSFALCFSSPIQLYQTIHKFIF